MTLSSFLCVPPSLLGGLFLFVCPMRGVGHLRTPSLANNFRWVDGWMGGRVLGWTVWCNRHQSNSMDGARSSGASGMSLSMSGASESASASATQDSSSVHFSQTQNPSVQEDRAKALEVYTCHFKYFSSLLGAVPPLLP